MKRKLTARPLLIALVVFCQLCLSVAAIAAIGVYNFGITESVETPHTYSVAYRLNCPGDVHVEILDSRGRVVRDLGELPEEKGPHSRTWDATGAATGTANYRARITAEVAAADPRLGAPGTLVKLSSGLITNAIYGLTIDRFPDSPGYGTIYVSDVAKNSVRAYYADGNPKTDFGASGTLSLGGAAKTAPFGIGVDRQGNVYVGVNGATANTAIKVYDHEGKIQLYNVSPTGGTGKVFWLDGLWTEAGLEVYKTTGGTVAYGSTLTSPSWQTAMDPGVAAAKTGQLCFETGGSACYVATSGVDYPANLGVTRFVRGQSGAWAKDAGFDIGLSGPAGSASAARSASGVSCDSRDPDGDGPYTATSLWVGLNCSVTLFGGNIVRALLPGGTPQYFSAPTADLVGNIRFVAADSVGNVAIDYGGSGLTGLYSNWALYAPGGEPSTDTRLTDWIAVSAASAAELVECIRDLTAKPDDCVVQLGSGKCVTAVFGDCFYVGESDRSGGIKVCCAAPVTEGSVVKIRGTLDTVLGERVLKNAEIISQ